MKIRNRGFVPVMDSDIEILILGSFPSVASLHKREYYAHPQNQFWRLLGMVLREPLAEMEYKQRLSSLLKYHIGLWDVIGICSRRGSLDTDIRHPRHNDFARVIRRAEKLRRICFNGRTAAKFSLTFAGWGYETVVLPSSSPAHATLRFEEKLKDWKKILD